MLVYLLKMIACSAAFYGLYMLLFHNEKMFVFNRFYLLGSVLLSFFIPLITITVEAPLVPSSVINDRDIVAVEGSLLSSPQVSFTDYTMYWGVIIFVAISAGLMIRLICNYLKLRSVAKQGHQFYINNIQVVLLDQLLTPHSFLNTIFLNREEYNSGKIEDEVIQHEIAHIQQKHSWDIFLIECLQAFTWFNPIIYLYKRSIKINHELLADAAVVKELDNMRGYQHILLQRAGAQPSLALASSFHFFITKKRIIMLQKKANPVIAGLKATLSLPLLALLIFVFSERVYAQVVLEPHKIYATSDIASTGGGASPSELKEYSEIINSYKADGKEGHLQNKISARDRSRMEAIFKKMNRAQQNEQKIGFIKAAKPLEKKEPSVADYEKWKNPKIYGVWIDGKRVGNSVLNHYRNTDFSHVFVSRLSKNAVNYGKHYVQVDLMTHAAYEEYYKSAIADQDKLMLIYMFTKPKALLHQKKQSLGDSPGATSEELKTYEASISKLKTMQSGTESYKMLMEQTVLIHNKMTREQLAAATPLHPPLPPGPPPAINRSGIETVRVSASNGKPGEATIIFKNGNVAKGDVSTPEKARAFEEKYNVELPPPPPPAPPTRKKKAVAPTPAAVAEEKESLLHHPLSDHKKAKMPELARASEKKARSGSVRSGEPLSTEMVNYILQLVEKSYTAIAAPKGTSDWGMDNPIKTKLDF